LKSFFNDNVKFNVICHFKAWEYKKINLTKSRTGRVRGAPKVKSDPERYTY